MSLLFTFETLRYPQVVHHVIGHVPPHEKAVLISHKKVNARPNSKEWSLVKKADSTTRGIIYEVTTQELRELDDWEVDYKRDVGRLSDGRKAYVYILKEAHE